MTNLNFSVLQPYLHLFKDAIAITFKVGVFSFLVATLISIFVGSLRTRNPHKIIKFFLSSYVEFFRGTPLLVQVFLVYYGLPSLGVKIDPIPAAIITMGLNSGAYLSENVRAAILSIDKGQYEAASILGYTTIQTTVHIVLPQAMRIAVPAFMNGFSSIIKETSLISVLPVVELTKLGNQIYAKTYHPFEIYITLAIVYFAMTYSVTFFARWIERRFSLWLN